MTDYSLITEGQAHEAFREKLFSRRTFLAAIPATLLMPHISHRSFRLLPAMTARRILPPFCLS